MRARRMPGGRRWAWSTTTATMMSASASCRSTAEGIDQLFRRFPQVHVLLDDGYLGLRRDHPGKAQTPPRKPNQIAAPEAREAWEDARHDHSSRRLPVEHALADHERWKQPTRWTHRRDTYHVVGVGSARDHVLLLGSASA